MHFLGFVAFHPLAQLSRIVHMRSRLQALLQLRNTSLNRVKHLPSLATSIAENEQPPVLAEFLSQSLHVLLQSLVAIPQPIASVFELLAGAWEYWLCP